MFEPLASWNESEATLQRIVFKRSHESATNLGKLAFLSVAETLGDSRQRLAFFEKVRSEREIGGPQSFSQFSSSN